MDKLSMAIVAMEVHVACTNDRLKQAWDVIHAELVEGQKPTTNTGSLQLLLSEFIKQCPSLDGSERILLSDFVSWTQQQQAGA